MEGKFGAPAPCRSEWPASFIRELEEAAKADDVAQNEQMIDISLAGAAVDLTKTVEILDFSKDDLDMQPAMEDRFGAPAPSNSESLASFICELEEAEDIDQSSYIPAGAAADLTEVMETLDSSKDDFDMEAVRRFSTGAKQLI